MVPIVNGLSNPDEIPGLLLVILGLLISFGGSRPEPAVTLPSPTGSEALVSIAGRPKVDVETGLLPDSTGLPDATGTA